jgi:hypothetical protein
METKPFRIFLTYDLPGATPNQHHQVEAGLESIGYSRTMNELRLPNNTFYKMLRIQDEASALDSAKSEVSCLFELKNVYARALIIIQEPDDLRSLMRFVPGPRP